jgi:hypothetical protein
VSERNYAGCLLSIGLFGLLGQAMADSAAPLSDPTRPNGWRENGRVEAAVTESTANALVLQGTFSVAGRRSAMIGGRRVSVGDQVDGAEVVEIDNNKVILQMAGETTEFYSSLPAVKSPTQSGEEGR